MAGVGLSMMMVGCDGPHPVLPVPGTVTAAEAETTYDDTYVYEHKLTEPIVVEDGETYDGLIDGRMTRLSRADADPIAIKNIRGELLHNQAGIVMELKPGAIVKNVIIAENCQIDAVLAGRMNIYLENVEWEDCAVNVITKDSPGYLSLTNCHGQASITYAPNISEAGPGNGSQEIAEAKQSKPSDDLSISNAPDYMGKRSKSASSGVSALKPPKWVPGKPFQNWKAQIAYHKAKQAS